MNFDNIPAELKQLRQWLVWRPRDLGQRKNVKVPYQCHNVWALASVNKPETWATFEEALTAVKAYPGLGLGFVFTTSDPYVGVDIDDETKVDPRNLDNFRALRAALLKGDSYTELSPSRNGAHMIVKAAMTKRGHRPHGVNVEIYGSGRFFTMTGDVINDRYTIHDGQELVDQFMLRFPDDGAGDDDPIFLGTTETNGRRLDMSDDEVLALAWKIPGFADRYNGVDINDWSVEHYKLVGDIDKITGDPEQLCRILHSSPFVMNSPDKGGVSRLRKSKRIIMDDLAAVRGNDNSFRHSIAMVEQGKAIWQRVEGFREQEARKRAEEILKEAESAFSKTGIQLLKAFPLPPQYLGLSVPPGITGRIARAVAEACHNPFLKFAIPATLATLSGILGRSYKLPSGVGLNLNFILAAATATGKTQTMAAWEQIIRRANNDIGNSLSGPARSRLIKAAASSIQGIFEDFMEVPSAVWFISECASQLAQMSSPKSTTDGQMRDAYNDLYDCSAMGRIFSPPRSVANRKANIEPIENLCVSTYWTTTTSKFDVFNDDAQDGFLSRVVIIRHVGRAGEAIPDWEVKPHLDDDLHQIMVNRLAAAKNFDEAFILSANEAYKLITRISTAQVEGQAWAFRQIAERVKNAALEGELPMAYTAVSRLPISALRLAGVLAVMDNPYEPTVTVEQFEWSFGYLLQNVASLLSDMDTGELGATLSMDTEVVIREVKKLMRKSGEIGVKKSELAKHLKHLKPFKDTPMPSEVVKRTIADMLTSDLLQEIQQTMPGRGRPAMMYVPTDDGAWS